MQKHMYGPSDQLVMSLLEAGQPKVAGVYG